MSESENASTVRINDRRRFDRDGNPVPAEDEMRTPVEAEGPEHGQSIEAQAQLDSLREQLDAAYRRIDELARAVQAGEREREEFKKRLTRERERMIEVEKGNVAQTLLEAVDDLDLSLSSADESPLAQGVRLIRDGILSRLSGLGVERVPLVGQPFDPNMAEAIDMEITASPDEDQKVVQELRPAYRLKERVIRPGRVKVARYIPPAQA